jgi:hypothetical protein
MTIFRLVEWLLMGCLIVGSVFATGVTFQLVLLAWSRRRWGIVVSHASMLLGWLVTLAVSVEGCVTGKLEQGLLSALILIFGTLLMALEGAEQWRKA